MAKDLGFSFGSRLESYAVGQAAAVSEVMEQVAAARLAAANLRQKAELALQSAGEDQTQSAADAAAWKVRADELIAARTDSPSDFSWGRGLFYIFIGILLLVGDLTILSGVLAQLLDLPFRAKDGMGEFSVFNIVNDPTKAWDLFRNVIVLTSSVLLLGFFPKLYFDVRLDRVTSTYRRSLQVVLILSIVAVVVTAFARWGLDTQQSGNSADGSWFIYDVASVLLGLALPYVSCFFFSVGVDRVGQRIDFWRATFMAARSNRSLRKARRRFEACSAELRAQTEAEAAVVSAEHEQRVRARVEAEYSQGFSDGSVALLDGREPGAVFAALRLIAIRRHLS